MPGEKPDSFQCGPFEVARNPDARVFTDKLNRLREAVDQCRLQDGVGYTVTRSSGGTTLTIRPGAGSSLPLVEHPFAIRVRTKDKQNQFWVTEGMVANADVKISNAQQWVNFQPPAVIFLEAGISGMAIQELTLKSQAFDQALERVTIASGEQTRARIAIGHYTSESQGKDDYRIVQNVQTNLLCPIFCYQGYPAMIFTQETSPTT